MQEHHEGIPLSSLDFCTDSIHEVNKRISNVHLINSSDINYHEGLQ